MRTLITLEYVCCPLCGADQGELVFSSPDHYAYAAGTFTVQRCRNCGLWYQNPRPIPEAFDTIYPPAYTPYQEERIERDHIPPDLAGSCALIARWQPEGSRLLDVGAGIGSFLRAMSLLLPDWDTSGIEPSLIAAERARSRGLKIYSTTLDKAELDQQNWDAVTLWNVIEHLPNPLAALQRIRQILRTNGLLYLTLPLHDSWDARIFRRYWLGWELPRHFVHYDRATLVQLLGRAGFKLREMVSLSGVAYCFDESLRIALRNLIPHYTTYRLFQGLLTSRPVHYLLWRHYLAIATWGCRTTVVTVVAQPTSAPQI